VDQNLEFLLWCGERLEHRPRNYGRSLRDVLIAALLKVRGRKGGLVPLRPNPVQRAFAAAPRTGQHIILKAR